MSRRFPCTVAVLVAAAAALLIPGAAGATPPTNDDFANATVIAPSSLPFNDQVTIDEATTEPSEGLSCGFPSSNAQTVWYSFTPSSSGTYRVSDSASFYYQLAAVYRQDGSGLAGLTNLACASWANGQNTTTFAAVSGTTYYIQSGSNFLSTGSVSLTVQAVPPPANDNFANATVISSLPFSDSADSSAATFEQGEPSSCGGPGETVWYAYTPSRAGSLTASLPYSGIYDTVAVYTGSGLGSLTQIACQPYYALATFPTIPGTTYYFQVGTGFGASALLRFQLDVAPAPVAGFVFYPTDPSIFDVVQFGDSSFDPGGNGISSERWTFGDGSPAASGCCPTHRYLKDGSYQVTLTVGTSDGRSATVTQTVPVQTHDVAIARVNVPQTGSPGHTRAISVDVANKRYAETVQVQLYSSVAGGQWQPVGTLTQYVPVRTGGRTTQFAFSYTFTPADAAVGKVNFQAVATIQGARDAVPTDNTFISVATKVH